MKTFSNDVAVSDLQVSIQRLEDREHVSATFALEHRRPLWRLTDCGHCRDVRFWQNEIPRAAMTPSAAQFERGTAISPQTQKPDPRYLR